MPTPDLCTEEEIHELVHAAMAERANDLAARITESLWYGYRMSRQVDPLPQEL